VFAGLILVCGKKKMWDRDRPVGIATRYGLDGPGIESRWRARFSAPVQNGPVAHSALGTGSFQGVKRPGRGVDHAPLSSADVKERVELYLYSPSGPRVNFSFAVKKVDNIWYSGIRAS
jgi:hypothetical protein